MIISTYSTTTEARYNQFVAELTALTRKYGVSIRSFGGVTIVDEVDDFRNVIYVADITSGDLYAEIPDA